MEIIKFQTVICFLGFCHSPLIQRTKTLKLLSFCWGYGKQILTGARNLATMSRLCSTPKKRCKDGKQQPFQILAITAFSNFWQNNGFLKFWQTTAFSHLGKLPFQILATNSHFTFWQLPFQNLANNSHSTFRQTAFPNLG